LLIKILEKKSKGLQVIMEVKWKGGVDCEGMKNWRLMSRFISKTIQDTAIVTMEDE